MGRGQAEVFEITDESWAQEASPPTATEELTARVSELSGNDSPVRRGSRRQRTLAIGAAALLLAGFSFTVLRNRGSGASQIKTAHGDRKSTARADLSARPSRDHAIAQPRNAWRRRVGRNILIERSRRQSAPPKRLANGKTGPPAGLLPPPVSTSPRTTSPGTEFSFER
jgi:hypothetical protein